MWRGTAYQYNYGEDCYTTGPAYYSPYGYGYGYGTGFGFGNGFGPPPVPAPVKPRIFAFGHPIGPPQPLPKVRFPMPGAQDAGAGSQVTNTSAHFRSRGLITTGGVSGAAAAPLSHDPRGITVMPTDGTSRPTIQQMVNRHGDYTHETSGAGRGQPTGQAIAIPSSGAEQHARTAPSPVSTGQTRIYTRPVPSGESPRVAPPRVESAPRVAPPTHVEAPRVEAPRSPPPASSSSSGSTGGKPPAKG